MITEFAYFCMAMLVAATVNGKESDSPKDIATWQGEKATVVDFNSWRQSQGLDDSANSIREFVFVQSFADLARKRGAQNDLRAKLEIEIARRKILSAALRADAVAKISITDEEIDLLRQTYPEAFMRPQKFRLRSVYKRLGDTSETAESVRSEMTQLRQELLEGADFGEIARHESESQSRFQDGRLGLVDPEEMPAPIAEVVRQLKVGEISEVIEHDGSVMIFGCEEIKSAVTPTADEVRAKLRANLWRIRKEEVEQSLGEQLLESVKVEIEPESADVVLRVGNYSFDARSMQALMKIKVPASTPADWDDGARRKLLRNWAIGYLEARKAVDNGLDKKEATAESLRWVPMQVLARNELVFRIDKELKPSSEKAMRDYYAENVRRYRVPEMYTLGVIRFGELSSSDGKAASQLVARAERAERQIASGELSFSDAARRYSTAPSAEDGGESRTLTRAQIGALGSVAGKAVARLKIGEHTELLRLRSGLWMFEVRDRQPARSKTFGEAEAAIRSDMRQQQVRALEIKLREEQLRLLNVDIVEARGAGN